MAELKDMTVKALRDLARKAIGRGHSRLKTKRELIEALQSAEQEITGAAHEAIARVKKATGKATGRAKAAAGKATSRAKAVAGKATGRAKVAVGKARKVAVKAKALAGKAVDVAGQAAQAADDLLQTAKGKPRKPRKAKAPARGKKARAKAAAARPDDDRPERPEGSLDLAPEGHLVARLAGEDGLRDAPHGMTEASPVSPEQGPVKPARNGLRPEFHFEEDLGELPAHYGDDAFIALPRDPRTLFVYWDHSEPALRDAWRGLHGARPQLWIFALGEGQRWDRVRTIDFALESRSYYVHDLDPGRVYRAEIHLVGEAGVERTIGAASNEMTLPPVGPSPIVDDRFVRLPWPEPLDKLLRHVRQGGPFPEDLRAQFARLSDWSGPVDAELGGSSGAGAAAGKASSPSSPFKPFGGSGSGEGR